MSVSVNVVKPLVKIVNPQEGEPVSLIRIMPDTAERKLVEEERDKIITSLIQHTKCLEQFTSLISHNLRAPVAHILGLSNVLKNNLSQEDRDLTQQYLISAAVRLDEMLKDLNVILQVEVDNNECRETVNFSELTESIKFRIQTVMKLENASIRTDFSLHESIFGIRSCLSGIFYKLIANSIKYKRPGIAPVIIIRSEADNNKVRIFFKDNGIGIDMTKHASKVFGLYKRFHAHTEGKGLGLFIVKTQVECLGGTIRITSAPDAGTEFIIELPCENR